MVRLSNLTINDCDVNLTGTQQGAGMWSGETRWV